VPAGQERMLRRRIRSVQSTQKITRAMELIAASRIIRAQQAIVAARPYTERMSEVVDQLASAPEARGHLVYAGGGDRSVVVVLAGDRGLSGAFNMMALRAGEDLVRDLSSSGAPAPAVIAVGRKAVGYFRFRQRPLAAAFEGIADRPRFEDAQKVVAAVTAELQRGDVGQLYVVSTRFTSIGSQRVQARRLVPVRREGAAEAEATVFELEPGPQEILDRLLPRWLEAEIYSALLESAASFHVAQQRAMKAATDNADELIKSLRRAMNRARQDAITTEIMEIVGGAEALREVGGEQAANPGAYAIPEAS
jgi:F-type H+-transporting ATPase subunit gamma